MRIRSLAKGAVLVAVSAALVTLLTLLGLFGFVYSVSDGGRNWNAPLSEISASLTRQEGGYVFSGENLLQGRWAMLLDEGGNLVWSFRKPEELPEKYTISDVASFSRWYLEDYPVQCWIREDGLLVVGSPRNSIWKHNLEMDMENMIAIPGWFLGFFLLSLGSVLGFAYLAARRWFRQEQQIRDAARSGWINGVSHDIRTPLSVVMGYSAQLEAAPDLSPENHRRAGAIRAQSQTIRDLVNDLNLTMRLDCAMQPLRMEKFMPEVFLRQLAADFLNGGMSDGFEFEILLPEMPLPVLQADPFLLRRALNNLLSNCVRHSLPGSSIRLGAENRGKELLFWVEGGPAQSAGSRPASSCTLEADGGAAHGTGLKLVAQIAAAHGGSARFSFGSSSRCELWLPYRCKGKS